MPSHKIDVEKVLEELTLNEKISLLAGVNFWQTAPLKRLDIPSVTVSDGPNGIRGTQFLKAVPSNCFPCGTGMASSFNKDLLSEVGKLMAKEAKMKSAHCVLGPTCNIVRNPLGGRAFESYSEDPYLSGHIAAALINGIQESKIVACLKHYVCNDQEDGKKGLDTILTERALREVYLKPFQLALRDSNPKALMTAYNKVNGEHVSSSKKLLKDILREEWGYEGLTMSDWFGTYSIKESLDAGLNLEMPGPARYRELVQTSHKVMSNEIHLDTIDSNARQVLQFIKDCLESGVESGSGEKANDDPAAGELLRKIGGESIVLLKNEDNILPLNAEKSSNNELIAIIGPNAKAERASGGGSASMRNRYTISPWQGISDKVREKAGSNAVLLEYSLGANLNKILPDIGPFLANESGERGVTVKFYAEAPGSPQREVIERVISYTSQVFLSDFKSEKLDTNKALFYADFEGTYIPEESGDYWIGCSCLGTAQIFLDGKLVVDNKTHQIKGDAFFLAMGTREERSIVKLEKGKEYKLKVEFGSGATSPLFSQEPGGVYFGIEPVVPDETALQNAIDLAKRANKVVLITGLSKDYETEGFDRPSMEVPGWTDVMITAVAKANPNVVVVNQSGSPVAMPWAKEVKGLLQAWYGGNELGNAIADVLFGDVNPSGKLSISFPKRLEDCPSYLNFGSTNGRVLYGEDVFVGYKYFEKVDCEPLFCFGHGLSYTSFRISEPRLSLDEKNATVHVQVTNTGKVAGQEVVQVYIEPQSPKIIRPKKELRDFAKVYLKPGETKSVSVVLPILDATSYWDSYKSKWLSEKGVYKILVGTSSANIEVEVEFETSEDKWWSGL